MPVNSSGITVYPIEVQMLSMGGGPLDMISVLIDPHQKWQKCEYDNFVVLSHKNVKIKLGKNQWQEYFRRK